MGGGGVDGRGGEQSSLLLTSKSGGRVNCVV